MPGTDAFFNANDCLRAMIASQKDIIQLTDSGMLMDGIKNIIVQMERYDNPLKVQLLIYQFLLDFSCLFVESRNSETLNSYVSQSINYIVNNYDYPIKVEDISKEIGLHPNYLHRIFKKQTGRSIMTYINDIRLQRAKKLLTTTKFTIQEISELVGYNSRQYFTAKFQTAFSISPAAYRKTIVPWHLV